MGTILFGLILVGILALIAVLGIRDFLDNQNVKLAVWMQIVLFLLIVLAFALVPLSTSARYIFASL